MKDKLMKLLVIMVAAFIMCTPITAKAEKADLMTIDKPVDAFTFGAAKNGVLTELKKDDEGVIEVEVAESGYIIIGATEFCQVTLYSDNELTKSLKYRICDYDEYSDNKVNYDNVSIDELVSAFKKFIDRKEFEKPLNTKVTTKELSVSERVKSIRDILKYKKEFEFVSLFDRLDKSYIVVTFLSILEMSKSNEIVIVQDGNFSNILIKGCD